MTEQLKTTYLEMTSPDELCGKYLPEGALTVCRLGAPLPAFNRFLYTEVGRAWQWRQKLAWSPEQWEAYVCRTGFHTIVAYHQGTPVGYAELLEQDGGDVEVCYFGLLEAFIGKGFGGALLTAAIETAWSLPDTRRVWLHTCSRDHAAALPNYQARGFRIFRHEG